MAFNGSGTYTLPAGNPVVTGTTISSSTTNTTNSDIATALTNCLTRDGQSPPSANLPMNAKKLTGLAAGTSAGDSVRYEQIQYLDSVASAGTSGQVLTSAGAGAPTWQTPTTGTVTSVTGTAPVASSGGTTPVISIPAATTSTSGYLTSTDWNMFDGKYSTGDALGTPSSGTLSSCTVDGTNAVGYKKIPQTGSDKTSSYTLATTDVGKYVGVGTSGSIVVPTSTFANGDAISIYNNTTSNITITTSAPTAYIAGANTVKTSIILATRGIATILFVSSTVCVVAGNVS